MGWQDDKVVAPASAASAPAGGNFWEKDKPSESSVMEDLKYLPGFLAQSGRQIGGAAVQSAVDLNKLGAKFNPLAKISQSLFPQPLQAAEKAAQAIDVPSEKTPDGDTPLWDSAMRGIGRSATMPLPGAGLAANVLTGAMSGLGGELGGRGGAAISTDPKARMAGEFLGGAVGGGGTAFGVAPRMPVAQQDIRRALKGTTPAEFDAAHANALAARDAGAKTATAAEMFDPNSPVMALANKVRNGTLDNSLRTQTQGRLEDLQQLGDAFKSRIGPQVDPNQVANNAAERATEVVSGHRASAGDTMGKSLRPHNLTNRQVTGLYTDLYTAGEGQPRLSAGEAYRDVADSLVGQDGAPLTNLQQISLAIKGMKDAPRAPAPGQAPSRNISSGDNRSAISAAEMGLGELSPEFRNANDAFRAFMQGPHEQMRTGPLGSLADRNPITAGQTPVSRLEGMLTGNSPQTIKETAYHLDPQGPLPANQVGSARANAAEIARALAEQRMRLGTTDPGKTMRGLPGSTAENQFGALLEAAGQNPQQTMAPLAVADKMQAFKNPAGFNELPNIGVAQFIRPFRSADMLMSGRSEKAVSREVSALLANPSPENIRKLQTLAMTNPHLRSLLSARSAFTGDTQE